MGIGLDEAEKLLKVLILFIVLIVVVAVLIKLNQTWGFLSTWKDSILCWAPLGISGAMLHYISHGLGKGRVTR